MFGTNMTYDLLVTRFEDTIEQITENAVYDAIEDGLRVQTRITAEVFSFYADVRTENRFPGEHRYETFGGNRVLRGRRVDQIGVVPPGKVTAGYPIGFPVGRRQYAIQWDEDFLKWATVDDLLKDFNATRQGNTIDIRSDLLNCIFSPANRTEVEAFHNGAAVEVKALANADGLEIPEGPNGEVFDGATHQHYMAINGVTQAAVRELIENVKEHYAAGTVHVFINKAEEASVRAFALFREYAEPNVVYPGGFTEILASGTQRDMPLDDYAIGTLDNAVFHVKPWMPANYYFALIVGPSIKKIARIRQRGSGLYLAAKIPTFPLRADLFQHDYGCGIQERTAGAVLYTGGGVYTAPTFS